MSANLLDEIISRFDEQPEEDRKAIIETVKKATAGRRWFPNPGPQSDAFFSQADELFYGGAAGGGKTDLIVGLSDSEHQKSLVLRRIGQNLRAIEDRYSDLEGSRKNYSSQTGIWRLATGRSVQLGHCQYEDNKRNYQGQPHDLKAFDELPQFTKSQYLYIIGWNRTTIPGQRCRVIGAGNPPMDPEEEWVTEYWGPWLDEDHPNPAKPGELRWYTVVEGESVEREGPDDVEVVVINGERKSIKPKSRTFIPAFTTDNPFLGEDYLATLAATPEPMRSKLLHGSFNSVTEDPPDQVIPTQWIIEAQKRWTKERPRHIPMSALGVDVAMGGKDYEVITPRYGGYFGEQKRIPGKDTPSPKETVSEIVKIIEDKARVGVDMGGGYGSGVADRLEDIPIDVHKFVPSAESTRRDRTGTISFVNRRAEAIWNFRDALDPDGGYTIALPPGAALRKDLAAYRFKVVERSDGGVIKIKIESKEDMKKRIGRSTDDGDSAVIAWDTGEITNAVTSMMKADKTRMAKDSWSTPKVNTRARSASRLAGRM